MSKSTNYNQLFSRSILFYMIIKSGFGLTCNEFYEQIKTICNSYEETSFE